MDWSSQNRMSIVRLLSEGKREIEKQERSRRQLHLGDIRIKKVKWPSFLRDFKTGRERNKEYAEKVYEKSVGCNQEIKIKYKREQEQETLYVNLRQEKKRKLTALGKASLSGEASVRPSNLSTRYSLSTPHSI